MEGTITKLMKKDPEGRVRKGGRRDYGGYGFIRDSAGEDRFFHAKSVVDTRFEALAVGVGVTFEPEVGDNGLRAVQVRAR